MDDKVRMWISIFVTVFLLSLVVFNGWLAYSQWQNSNEQPKTWHYHVGGDLMKAGMTEEQKLEWAKHFAVYNYNHVGLSDDFYNNLPTDLKGLFLEEKLEQCPGLKSESD